MSPEVPEGMDPETFKRLLEDYKKSIPEKLSTMKVALQKLKEKFNLEDLTALRFVIHKTAGNAGTFGYPKVSDLCKTWDAKLTPMVESQAEAAPNAQFFEEIQAFISEIEKEFQNG